MSAPTLTTWDPTRAAQPAAVRRGAKSTAQQEKIRFESFVGSLYGCQTEKNLRDVIVRELLNFVPGQNAVVNNFHLTKGSIHSIVATHDFSRGFLEGAKTFIHEHPTFRDLETRQRYRERLVSDSLTRIKWHRTSLYNEAYRVDGLEDQMGVGVCRSGPLCTGVAILRDKRGFAAKDRQRMSLLAIHFDQAFANVRAIERLQLSADRSEAELKAISYGAIWLDEQLQVLEINARAAAWWSEFFPQDGMTSRLPGAVEEWLQKNDRKSPPSLAWNQSLVRYSERARLTIRCISAPKTKSRLLVLERKIFRPVLEDLRPLGLTTRESEVLLWVAQGKANHEIASILGGSRRTIDKHVQNLLLKLKLENRASAVLLVADLMQ
jgi:DNA-binding CsgD family transcriptional regulator